MIQDVLRAFATSSDAGDISLVNGATSRTNGNITIIIENVPEYTTGNAHYRVKDGRTAYIRYERLSATTSSQGNVSATLRGAIGLISQTPLPTL